MRTSWRRRQRSWSWRRWSGYDILGLVQAIGSERFLFGSGYPFRDPVSAVMRLEIASELDQRTKAAIWNDNTRRMLTISGHQ